MGVVVDAHGNDVMMNSQQRRVHPLGIPQDVADPREDQLLVFDHDKVTPVPAAQRPVRRAIDGASFTDQLIWLGDERQRRALSVSASPMKDPSGASAGSVIVFNDVTQLVEALHVKDDFLHMVTHELRTPLTSILGYIDLALDQAESSPETADLAANLRVAERNAARLLGLVSDLLDTATVPSIHIRPGNLADVVRSSLISARPQAEAKGITLIDRSPPSLPGHFDPDRIHQVLDNLISNAIKYSSAGDAVTSRVWSDDDAALVLQIQDTGRGISESDQQQLFEKFFRTRGVRESAIPGLGLGLSLTKAMVEAHRGTITVESAPGEGATFTVIIPATPSGARNGARPG
ncbi:MAG: sensor histidine kinase [Nesterenkonia sp.]